MKPTPDNLHPQPYGPNVGDGEAVILDILWVGDLLERIGNARVYGEKLSQAQFNILFILRRYGQEGMSQKQIMENLVTTKGNVSIHVSNLSKSGYIRKRTSKHDGRMQVITLTPKGKRILERLEPIYLAQVEKIMNRFSKQEIKTTLATLAKFRTICDEELEGVS